MSKLQIIDARKMERILVNQGFEKTRQKGSHAFFRHKDGRTTTVPYHLGKDLARPLIKAIFNDINMSVQKFNDLLKNM